jgi:hypothetical protein
MSDLEYLKSCRESTAKFIQIANKNEEISKRNFEKSTKLSNLVSQWEQEQKVYKNRLNEWETMSGEYAQWDRIKRDLQNEKRNWNNCIPWNETSAGKHNDWCRNDNNGEDWYHAGQDGGGCTPGFGKGVCQRTNDQVNKQLEIRGYDNSKPVFLKPKPDETNQPDLAQEEQIRSDTNIQCCANIMNITGNAFDVAQSCQQSIEQTLIGLGEELAPIEELQDDATVTKQNIIDNRTAIIIGIVIFIIMILSLSSILLVSA